ncbi:hypothetical protein BESB_018410 [Besnoitia besnoiti]|uniref:Secreted protein n=1 Tax=Besnoitia besnoiti TaxID=94643 RepID=A0A2A9MA20_BESBE|nr:hypothetical protein BESB_018410 [Besnoitia besnoiti]PFH32523.1 hypothetical protein BESB_018410 [Besnoitia besnoiti]
MQVGVPACFLFLSVFVVACLLNGTEAAHALLLTKSKHKKPGLSGEGAKHEGKHGKKKESSKKGDKEHHGEKNESKDSHKKVKHPRTVDEVYGW